MNTRLLTLKKSILGMGIVNVLVYIWRTKLVNWFHRYIYERNGSSYVLSKLGSKALRHSVHFRYKSSDIYVFSQIFVLDEYSEIPDLKNVKLIIDCGANVGYSSAYFLSRFPRAEVIAIEPDKSNYDVLKKNVEPYGKRVSALRSAIWSRSAGLVISEPQFGEAKEWATTVREARPDETPDISSVDIGTLLNESGHESIDILKIDIEGAESEVFRYNYQNWLEKVRVIVIELHGKKCREIFETALSPYKFRFTKSGELTIAEKL